MTEDNRSFAWWHLAIGMVSAAVLTASFAPSPSTDPNWIRCDDLRKSTDIKYTGTVYDSRPGSHIYFETVGGHENGTNFLLTMDRANITQDVPFEFTETIWITCEEGEVTASNFIWPAKEVSEDVRN